MHKITVESLTAKEKRNGKKCRCKSKAIGKITTPKGTRYVCNKSKCQSSAGKKLR